ncbi:MAG: hypothetical protein OXH09_11490 [Gammaproteobacteria bacterium]|nr:hypothetical protein [Gammaproteobacteria bacterium]
MNEKPATTNDEATSIRATLRNTLSEDKELEGRTWRFMQTQPDAKVTDVMAEMAWERTVPDMPGSWSKRSRPAKFRSETTTPPTQWPSAWRDSPVGTRVGYRQMRRDTS